MIGMINAIEREANTFKLLLRSIDGVTNVTEPSIRYSCHRIEFTVCLHRNGKQVDVGVAYCADGNKNLTYWVEYMPEEWPNDGYETEYTPNDEFSELEELIKKHT